MGVAMRGIAGAILGPYQTYVIPFLKNSVKITIPCKSRFLSGRGSKIWLKNRVSLPDTSYSKQTKWLGNAPCSKRAFYFNESITLLKQWESLI